MSAQSSCQALVLSLRTFADAAAAYRGVVNADQNLVDTYQSAYDGVSSTLSAFVQASQIGAAPNVTFSVIGVNPYQMTQQTWNATQLGTWLQNNFAQYGCLSPADLRTAADALDAIALQYDY